MSTRTSLPWSRIAAETKRAVRAFAESEGQRDLHVVNTRRLAEFVDADKEKYPLVTSGVTFKGIQGRLTMSMTRMGWKRWTTTAQKGMKFVVPWKELRT